MGFFAPYSAGPGCRGCKEHASEDLLRTPGCSQMRRAEKGFLDGAFCPMKWWLESVWEEVTAHGRLQNCQKSNGHLYRDLQARLRGRGLIVPNILMKAGHSVQAAWRWRRTRRTLSGRTAIVISGSGRGVDGLCGDFPEVSTALPRFW